MIDITHKDAVESNSLEIDGIEFVKVVRCRDCLYWDEETKWMPKHFDYICKCVLQDRWTEDDEFCSDGIRMEQNDE